MQETYRGPRIGQYATSFEIASSSRNASLARRVVSAAFRLAFVGLLVAGGWFGYRLVNDFLKPDFPGTIDGIPKTLDSGAGGLLGPVGRWASSLHLKTRSQVYGSAVQDNQDAFVVTKVTGWSGRFSPDKLLADLVNSGSQLKVPANQVKHERIGTTDYSCLTGKDMATRCLWSSAVGEVVIMVSGPSRSYDQVAELTAAAHDAM
ncbi:MAG: hypothetical protein HY240_10135 [Actinobacteria bacterium]|nr:hypothetical protein [Actinomycetota bacterium]